MVGHEPGRGRLLAHIVDGRRGRVGAQVVGLGEPRRQVGVVQALGDLATQHPDAHARLDRARLDRAVPPRYRGRRAGRLLDDQLVLAHAGHLPRRAAQHEHVADAQAVVHELRLHAPDALAVALDHHVVLGALGDRADAHGADMRGSAGSGQTPGRAVPQHQRARRTGHVERVLAPDHAEHGVELGARQLRVRVGAAHQGEQLVGVAVPGRHSADDLLREHVQTPARDAHRVHLAGDHRVADRPRLQQLVPLEHQHAPLARGVEQVTRTPDALQTRGHRFGRLELVHQVDRPDVDAELQRRGGDQGVESAGLQRVLGLQPRLFGHAAVMGADPGGRVGLLVQTQRRALRLVAAVGEDERGIVARHLAQ